MMTLESGGDFLPIMPGQPVKTVRGDVTSRHKLPRRCGTSPQYPDALTGEATRKDRGPVLQRAFRIVAFPRQSNNLYLKSP